MFHIIPNLQVDKTKWTRVVNSSQSNVVYAQPWFLDAVAPNWSLITNRDYTVGLPVFSGKKLGQPFICQPAFCQQLNIYHAQSISASKQLELLQSIPDNFRLIDIHLNLEMPQIPMNYWAQCRRSQELLIDRPYPEIAAGYKRGLRYAIRKAKKYGLECEMDLSLSEFEKFALTSELYRQQVHYRNNHQKLIDLARAAKLNHSGSCMGVRSQDGQLISIALILWDNKKIYTSFLCNNSVGRESCGSHLMIDAVIRFSDQRFETLDFVGSDIESVAFFNLQFGATTRNYFRVVRGSKSLSTCLRKTWNELAPAI